MGTRTLEEAVIEHARFELAYIHKHLTDDAVQMVLVDHINQMTNMELIRLMSRMAEKEFSGDGK